MSAEPPADLPELRLRTKLNDLRLRARVGHRGFCNYEVEALLDAYDIIHRTVGLLTTSDSEWGLIARRTLAVVDALVTPEAREGTTDGE